MVNTRQFQKNVWRLCYGSERPPTKFLRFGRNINIRSKKKLSVSAKSS
uniref:Uncharacterized protein n=1 Tax=Glossina morsitans morsitans TaxID=37546 RepID=A0A905AWQ8_GLOMM